MATGRANAGAARAPAPRNGSPEGDGLLSTCTPNCAEVLGETSSSFSPTELKPNLLVISRARVRVLHH